jgi:type II secretory pathway component PulL
MIRSTGIIVSIGAHEVRGLLFSSLFGRMKVEKTQSSSAIEELLSELPSDAPITAVLPGHLFMTRTVTVPFADAKIIRKVLPSELDGTLPLPIEDLLIENAPAARSDKGTVVFALALPKKTAVDYMALFPDGRKPVRIVPDFIALLSLARHCHDDNGIYGLLDVDGDSASVVIIGDGRPLAMRSTRTDGDWRSIVPWIEATITPLRNEGNQVDILYVTGAAAAHVLPLLPRMAQIAPRPEAVKGVDAREWPAWAGVAGGALSASEFSSFNVLGVHADHGTFTRTLRILSVGSAIVLVLGTADTYVRYRTASDAVAALKAESRRVFSSVMPQVKHIVKEDAQLKVALASERQTRDALLGASSPSYLAIAHGLGRLVIDHPELKVREAVVEAGSLTVIGDGRGVGSDGLKKLFSAIDGAQGAQVEELVQGVDPNTYRFRVKVQVK